MAADRLAADKPPPDDEDAINGPVAADRFEGRTTGADAGAVGNVAGVDEDGIEDPVAAIRFVVTGAGTGAVGNITGVDEDVIAGAVAEDRFDANVGDDDLGTDAGDVGLNDEFPRPLLALEVDIYTHRHDV